VGVVFFPWLKVLTGVVKTQWLDAWIREPAALRKPTAKKRREIDQIQDYLKAVSIYLFLRSVAV
jgi:hypothetical protein